MGDRADAAAIRAADNMLRQIDPETSWTPNDVANYAAEILAALEVTMANRDLSQHITKEQS